MSPGETALQSQATAKLELRMVSSAGLTSRHVLLSPSRRAAATGAGTDGWMGQQAGWSVSPMKLHAKTTKLLRLGQFQMFTFQPRQADTDVQEGADRPLVSICFTADACASV